MNPFDVRLPCASSLSMPFWIVPTTEIKGRLIYTEFFTPLRSENDGLALNSLSQYSSSEPLL